MKVGLKILLGSFCGFLFGLISQTDSQAKTINVALKTPGYTRNYLPNGQAALYSEPDNTGTIVAKASDLQKLSKTADSGQSYFHAFRAYKSTAGQWFLNVSSFDKKYQGWIYVGNKSPLKNSTKVSGGLYHVNTFERLILAAGFSKKTFYFKVPTAPTLTFTKPDWTTYGVGRNMNSLTKYASDRLHVTKDGEKTHGRDGDAEYYYVVDKKHPKVNGWINVNAVSKIPPKLIYSY